MWNDNLFTKALNTQYPIIQAGMAGGPTTPELVAAVSNAGGLGTLGAGYMKPNQMKEAIQRIQELTNQPFAVNLFIPEIQDVSERQIKKANELLQPFREELKLTEPEIATSSTETFEKQLEVVMQEEVAVCSFTFGVPSTRVIQQLKEKNIVVVGTATTVKEALINEEKGVDMVVMQGSEAGGHRGTFADTFENGMVGTMSLIPQTVDQVNIPVIAAGGIMDGRGVLAALTLGAQAVQMGTAFLTVLESGAKQQHIAAILNSTEAQTVITSVISGKPARGIQNEFITKLQPYEKSLPEYPILNTLTKSIRSEAAKQNRPEWVHMWSGQSPRLCKRQTVEKLIADIAAQVDEIMKSRR
ncbi:nitronate monooxygenase [Gracilibacillus caseinilyticus]|uniref:Probable nitronate monooxygenase n=1 Tax=Gracilibacillus caseinilyticus TaxID=2932256 RepID=A0ABY4EY05_9BACI|nr:nitronate monooxygenase [Gracilibacillus caseinilyticus]UOQ48737.1 nitronate monooxygenase [Gracilibacillus caseinilyticus]